MSKKHLKALAHEIAAKLLAGDLAAPLEAVKSGATAGMSRSDMFELGREVTNIAGRLAYSAGIMTGLASELGDDDERVTKPDMPSGLH